ncbi:acyl-CoA N-acyltransferase [Crucibulum laeve]|uniref:Acyl-CoA N-acyltransferase n=1 Tax=Crucibulum laeve TaxID=68775 RepID=A0A5C3M5J6_9AGAR|nr:acyl-CoA N-acyltransferase [Crucibulum laeve]
MTSTSASHPSRAFAFIMFSTELTTLRAYGPTDLPVLLGLLNNPLKIEEIANKAMLYVVVEPKEKPGQIIGRCFHHQVWGKGYDTEVTRFLVNYAFKNLAVHRISLGVFDSNAGAMKLYKKIGFIEEGRKRKANAVKSKPRRTSPSLRVTAGRVSELKPDSRIVSPLPSSVTVSPDV